VTTVRSLRPEERDDVRALLTEAYQQYETAMTPIAYGPYMTSVLNTEDGNTFVAVDDGKLLGSARLFLPGAAPLALRKPLDWANPMPADWAWVRAVGVRPAARGTGVAAALMRHCAENATGATAILLHTMDFMPGAIRLYERLGYERAPEFDFHAGRAAAVSPEDMFFAIAYRLTLVR
jgi:GNAT superfamily N-acetyltransferase